ncbi:MAG TPA: transcription antitermination factor NusB [Spirochaetia bacterium]|nr:transcription antitermination factor NusB [Spirochaetia bacterium]
MLTRRKGRIIAFQAIYGWEFTRAPLHDVLHLTWLEANSPAEDSEPDSDSGESVELTFPRLLVAGTIENIESIDRTIKAQLKHWDFDRVVRADLAILRMSVYSLLYQPEIPASVTIDEAIDIAKEFGTDDSYKFINGVLDGIRKGLKENQTGTSE